MGRIEAFDGYWVEPDVGLAIAHGLKTLRVRLPTRTRRCCCAGPSGPTASEDHDGRHRQRPIPRRRIPARP
jgi:hypothetical protein